MSIRLEVAELLCKVLAGSVSADDALAAWPAVDQGEDKLIRRAWHSLYHYSVDDDIRAKDESYAIYQRTKLQELITALKKEISE